MGRARFLLAILLLCPALCAQTTLVLKSGQRYDLKGPGRVKNGVVTFTTTNGHFLSIKQTDILQEVPTPGAAATKPLNGTDSRELGEIARQGREEKGVSAPVDPKPKPSPPAAEGKRKGRKKAAPKKQPPPEPKGP